MALFGLGSNGSGQLGIGHYNDVSEPTLHISYGFSGGSECQLDTTTSRRSLSTPSTICAGGNHTLILTADGVLSLSGKQANESKRGHDEHGSVDQDLHKTDNPELERLGASLQTTLMAQNVRLCSATWEASIIVKEDNSIFSYGQGDRGELGRDDTATDSQVELSLLASPDSNPEMPRIIDLASGVNHTVIVLDNGQVWGWGNGRKGQLGEGNDFVHRPRKVEGLDFKVSRAVCGREFTFLVGDPPTGRCCVLGSNKWGVVETAPAAVPGWKDIGACWGSISVLLDSGEIVAWGRSDHGQLARKGLPPIIKMACGSEHCLALTEDGKVLTWGWGEHGNCGPVVDADHDVKNGWTELRLPDQLQRGPVVGIGAGCATSWIWTDA